MDVSGVGSFGINLKSFSKTLSQDNTLAIFGDYVGINTSTPGSTFVVQGDAEIYGNFTVCVSPGVCGYVSSTDGSWYTSSDISLKKNITDFTGGLDKVLAMRPVGYEFNNEADANGTSHIGFIAQEMEQILPQIVGSNKVGLKSISYANLTPILVQAIKEQQAQIDALKTATATLTVENSSNQILYTVDIGMDIAGRPLLNVASIIGANNKWEIDINGTLITKITTASGEEKKLYGMSSENVEITLSGTSTLENGEAKIIFATDTQEIIDETQPIKVVFSLTSPCNKNIYVSEKSKEGFVLKEVEGMDSGITFDWMVLAKRKFSDPFIEEIVADEESNNSIEETPSEINANTTTVTSELESIESATEEMPIVSESPVNEEQTTVEPETEIPPSENTIEQDQSSEPTTETTDTSEPQPVETPIE